MSLQGNSQGSHTEKRKPQNKKDKTAQNRKKTEKNNRIRALVESLILDPKNKNAFQIVVDFLKLREIIMLKNLNKSFKRDIMVPHFTDSRRLMIYSETLNYKLACRFLKLFSGVNEILIRPGKTSLSTHELRKMITLCS